MTHSPRILITGSAGLVGQTLAACTQAGPYSIRGVDLRTAPEQDVLRFDALVRAVEGCVGIVHLAAVSRVIWAERDPTACRRTNIEGTRNVIRAALEARPRPWVLFASSREVYGQPAILPANEETPLAPVNVYGETKVTAEQLLASARRDGLQVAIARLSNVYGRTDDHGDRVVPAFARAAAGGQPMRVDGSEHLFDFTHVDDTALGLLRIIELLEQGERDLPPIHLLTGRPTSLGQLARMANSIGGGRSELCEAPPRSYDVARFWGDPRRARMLLGWSAQIELAEGLRRLIDDFAQTMHTKQS